MESVIFEGNPYTVSFEAMPETLKEKLSEEELKTYLELLQQCQLKPRGVYKEVKAFCEERQAVPEIANLLTFAHIQNHRIVEAENLIKETYLNHPDYLFARINYADQCVRKKKLEEVEKIFPTFDLKELEPEREVFHTSEFRGFMIMMAYYRLARKERELALPYFRMAKEIEPHHPSVMHLEKKLFKRSLIQRLLSKRLSSSRR